MKNCHFRNWGRVTIFHGSLNFLGNSFTQLDNWKHLFKALVTNRNFWNIFKSKAHLMYNYKKVQKSVFSPVKIILVFVNFVNKAEFCIEISRKLHEYPSGKLNLRFVFKSFSLLLMSFLHCIFFTPSILFYLNKSSLLG